MYKYCTGGVPTYKTDWNTSYILQYKNLHFFYYFTLIFDEFLRSDKLLLCHEIEFLKEKLRPFVLRGVVDMYDMEITGDVQNKFPRWDAILLCKKYGTIIVRLYSLYIWYKTMSADILNTVRQQSPKQILFNLLLCSVHGIAMMMIT